MHCFFFFFSPTKETNANCYLSSNCQLLCHRDPTMPQLCAPDSRGWGFYTRRTLPSVVRRLCYADGDPKLRPRVASVSSPGDTEYAFAPAHLRLPGGQVPLLMGILVGGVGDVKRRPVNSAGYRRNRRFGTYFNDGVTVKYDGGWKSAKKFWWCCWLRIYKNGFYIDALSLCEM